MEYLEKREEMVSVVGVCLTDKVFDKYVKKYAPAKESNLYGILSSEDNPDVEISEENNCMTIEEEREYSRHLAGCKKCLNKLMEEVYHVKNWF